MGKIIGIDLGSTASAVAVVENGTPSIIVNAEGNRTTPSIINYTTEGERVVGETAKRKAITNPKNTIELIKRFIGNTYSSTKEYRDKFTYDIVSGPNDSVRVKINGKEYTAQELSAAILQKMKKTAEDYLGEPVTDAVITVPAYFNDSQRTATKEAGEIAGLNVKRIINEPTAAALAFGIDKLNKNLRVLVFDCGGSTHDVSILEMGDGVFEVLSTKGDMFLGGNDIDNMIVEYLIAEGKKKCNNVDLSKDTIALQRLKEAAEKAKIELSTAMQTEISLPYITVVDNIPQHLQCVLTRATFNAMISGFVDKAMQVAKDALSLAKLTPNDIDEVLLVGGSTRIPLIQEEIKKYFGKEGNKSVNPDEAVALGAAIQGAILSGEQTGIILLDVTPLNLNITTMGDIAVCMIPANTTIPTTKSDIFSTAADNQPAVDIEVTQGNRKFSKDNKCLGKFILDGILPSKRGVPQIEVTFDIDANGILNVKAIDKATNKSQNIRIEGSSGLTDDEIKRMRDEAVAHEAEDKEREQRISLLNTVESEIYRTEHNLDDMKDKLSEEQTTKVKDALDNLKSVYNVKDEDRDLETITASMKNLMETWQTVTDELSKSNAVNNDSSIFTQFQEESK